MDLKIKNDLERAKELFYSWKLAEAYAIFRRFYDRIPFKVEPEHAEYIGMFSRTLLELGKDNELNFYLGSFERLYEKLKTPEVGYQLAYVYTVGPARSIKSATRILNELMPMPKSPSLEAKVKLVLAYTYDVSDGDVKAMKEIVHSIDTAGLDPDLTTNVEIWKAKTLRDNKEFSEADNSLNKILGSLKPDTNWYLYFYAQIILAGSLIEQGKESDARSIIKEIYTLTDGKSFKTIRLQLSALEKKIDSQKSMGLVTCIEGLNTMRLNYQNKEVEVENKSTARRILSYLTKKRYLSKALIVKLLYNKERVAGDDDKLVYYHIHVVRKIFAKLGLPADALRTEEDGYRFIPEVKIVEGEI